MSVGFGPIGLGLLGAALVVPLAGYAITHAAPQRDVSADFTSSEVVVSSEAPLVLRGTTHDNFDRGAVLASLDGVQAPIVWSDRAFEVRLRPASQGAHLLTLGIAYGGGIARTIGVPVITGPFATRGDWIEGAVEISLTPHQIDDGNSATGTDLAGAIRHYIRHAEMPATGLGYLVDCPITIRAGDDNASLEVRGTAYFEHGSAQFAVQLRFTQVGPQHLALEATRIHAEPGERAVAFAHHGAGASFVSAMSRGFTGHDAVSTMVRQRTQTNMEQLVRSMLPRLNDAMRIPATIALESVFHGVTAEVRFQGPPRFSPDRGMTIRLDVRFVGLHAPADTHGPLQLTSIPPIVADGHAHLRISPALTAAVLDIYAVSDRLEMALNGALQAAPPSDGPIHVDGVRLRSPGMFQPGLGGIPAWVLPDVQVETHGDRGAPIREIHAFAQGTFDVSLRGDHRVVSMTTHVERVALSCREHPEGVVRFVPCMSDVVTAGVDLPRLINQHLTTIDLFASTLDRIANLRVVGSFPILIETHSLAIDRASGQPVIDLAVQVGFETSTH